MALPIRLFYSAQSLPTDVEKSWKDAEELLDGLAAIDKKDSMEEHLREQRKAVRSRWIDQGRRYDALWRNSRVAHYGLRIPIIAGSATVPVLASLSVPRIATALVGLMVAILAALDGFFHYGDRWQQQRRAATAIRHEGWEFVELAGVYKVFKGKPRSDAYTCFLTKLEELSEHLELTYLALFRDSDQKSPRAVHGKHTDS